MFANTHTDARAGRGWTSGATLQHVILRAIFYARAPKSERAAGRWVPTNERASTRRVEEGEMVHVPCVRACFDAADTDQDQTLI